jgi:hypothetical protein
MAAMEQAVIRSLPAATEAAKVLERFEDRMAAVEAAPIKSDVLKLTEHVEDMHKKHTLLEEQMVKRDEREASATKSELASAVADFDKVTAEMSKAIEDAVANMVHSGVCEALERESEKTSKDNAELTCTVTPSDNGDSDPEAVPLALQKFRKEVRSQIEALENKINLHIEEALSLQRKASDEQIFSPQGLKAFEEVQVMRAKFAAVETRLQVIEQQDEAHVVSAAQQLLERRVSTIETKVQESLGGPEAWDKLKGRVSATEASVVSKADSKALETLESRVIAVEAWAKHVAVNIEQAITDSTTVQALERRVDSVEAVASKMNTQGQALESLEKTCLTLNRTTCWYAMGCLRVCETTLKAS